MPKTVVVRATQKLPLYSLNSLKVVQGGSILQYEVTWTARLCLVISPCLGVLFSSTWLRLAISIPSMSQARGRGKERSGGPSVSCVLSTSFPLSFLLLCGSTWEQGRQRETQSLAGWSCPAQSQGGILLPNEGSGGRFRETEISLCPDGFPGKGRRKCCHRVRPAPCRARETDAGEEDQAFGSDGGGGGAEASVTVNGELEVAECV